MTPKSPVFPSVNTPPPRPSAPPWTSIRAGTAGVAPRPAAPPADMAAPCAECPTAACCHYVSLYPFRVRTLRDLGHALYAARFDRVELGLTKDGDWGLYYRYPCRHFDRRTYACQAYGTLARPLLCTHYDASACHYRKTVMQAAGADFVRIDLPRLEVLAAAVGLDAAGNIATWPAFDELQRVLGAVPDLENGPTEGHPPDPGYAAWQELARGGAAAAASAAPPPAAAAGADPCAACAAYCCRNLVLPLGTPQTAADVDEVRFLLGFEGLAVALTDHGYRLIVQTACRALTADNRCGLFDSPERPFLCNEYDATRCHYRIEFGTARPAGHVRLRYEDFPAFARCFRFDEAGRVTAAPSVDELRGAVESQAGAGRAG